MTDEHKATRLLEGMVGKTYLIYKIQETVTSFKVGPVEVRISTDKRTHRINLQELEDALYSKFHGPVAKNDSVIPPDISSIKDEPVLPPINQISPAAANTSKKTRIYQIIKAAPFLLLKKEISGLYYDAYQAEIKSPSHAKYDVTNCLSAFIGTKMVYSYKVDWQVNRYYGAIDKFTAPGVPKPEFIPAHIRDLDKFGLPAKKTGRAPNAPDIKNNEVFLPDDIPLSPVEFKAVLPEDSKPISRHESIAELECRADQYEKDAKIIRDYIEVLRRRGWTGEVK